MTPRKTIWAGFLCAALLGGVAVLFVPAKSCACGVLTPEEERYNQSYLGKLDFLGELAWDALTQIIDYGMRDRAAGSIS